MGNDMAKKDELDSEDITLAFETVREYAELKAKELSVKASLSEVGGRLRTFFGVLGKQAGRVNGMVVMTYQKTRGFSEAKFRKEEPDLADEYTKSSLVLDICSDGLAELLGDLPGMTDDQLREFGRRLMGMVSGSHDVLEVDRLIKDHPRVADPYIIRALKVDQSAVKAISDSQIVINHVEG